MDECSKIHTGIWDLDFYKTNALFCHHYNSKTNGLCARLGGKTQRSRRQVDCRRSCRGQALIIDIQGVSGEASREASVESRGQLKK
jgi:hypothetical protein